MSWLRIWIHLVFSTKNRIPYLSTSDLRNKVFDHIKENARIKDIWLDEINGYHEHIHCLISLKREQTISKIAQLIKGESSNWINKQNLLRTKFSWQDDYWAVGISESHMRTVKQYIINQTEHHRKKSFDHEVKLFMKKYGWELIK